MTNITIFFSENNNEIRGFEAAGHADYAVEGEDIVCSGISVLTQTAIYGLVKVAGVKPRYLVREGNIFCMIPKLNQGIQAIQAQAILQTMYIGLRQMEEAYCQHIHISEKRRCH